MDNNFKRAKFGTMQPNIDNLLDLTPEDFDPASDAQKEAFIQERPSTSYWKDAWRRLKMNKVAMVALGVIIFLILFAFVGPVVVPYGYADFNKGAEDLYPWHYSLKDQELIDSFNNGDDATRLETAFAKAEKEKGSKLTSIEKAKITAQVSTSAGDINSFMSSPSSCPHG